MIMSKEAIASIKNAGVMTKGEIEDLMILMEEGQFEAMGITSITIRDRVVITFSEVKVTLLNGGTKK